MQICTLTQTDNHASTLPLSFFTGRMPFLLPNQQHQSTQGKSQQDEEKEDEEHCEATFWEVTQLKINHVKQVSTICEY